MTIPKTGDRIVFNTPPKSSWASAGKPYTVHVAGRTIWLKSDDGSGTFDQKWTYRFAAWHLA